MKSCTISIFSGAIGKSDSLGVDHLGAGARTFRCFHFDGAKLTDLVVPFGAQAPQPIKPSDIAFAPARHAIAHPVLLGGNLAFQLVTLDIFFFQHLIAPGFERPEGFFQPMRPTTIQPDGNAGEIFQKAPIMADQHQRAARGFQFAFQPFDGTHVQMVCRLIQQQDVGPRRQGAGKRRAPRLTAR